MQIHLFKVSEQHLAYSECFICPLLLLIHNLGMGQGSRDIGDMEVNNIRSLTLKSVEGDKQMVPM